MIFDVVTIRPGTISVVLNDGKQQPRHFTLRNKTSSLFSYFAQFADAGELQSDGPELKELFYSVKGQARQ